MLNDDKQILQFSSSNNIQWNFKCIPDTGVNRRFSEQIQLWQFNWIFIGYFTRKFIYKYFFLMKSNSKYIHFLSMYWNEIIQNAVLAYKVVKIHFFSLSLMVWHLNGFATCKLHFSHLYYVGIFFSLGVCAIFHGFHCYCTVK